MKIEDHIRYWLDSAAHDWETAENFKKQENVNITKQTSLWFGPFEKVKL